MIIPRCRAWVTASVLWFTSSFWNMLATWVLTMLSLMFRVPAIDLLAETGGAKASRARRCWE